MLLGSYVKFTLLLKIITDLSNKVVSTKIFIECPLVLDKVEELSGIMKVKKLLIIPKMVDLKF